MFSFGKIKVVELAMAFYIQKLCGILSMTSWYTYKFVSKAKSKCIVTQLVHFTILSILISFLVLLTETMMHGVKIVLKDFLELGGIVPVTIQI